MWYLCSVVGGPDLNYISKCDAWKEEEEEEILVSYHRDRAANIFTSPTEPKKYVLLINSHQEPKP